MDSQAHQVPMDLTGSEVLDSKDHQDPQADQDHGDDQGQGELRDHLVQGVNRDHKVLLVQTVPMVSLVLLDHPDRSVLPGTRLSRSVCINVSRWTET